MNYYIGSKVETFIITRFEYKLYFLISDQTSNESSRMSTIFGSGKAKKVGQVDLSKFKDKKHLKLKD